MTQITPSASSPTAATSATVPQNPLATLGKDDFLRLLVTQLKYQDPMNPTDNQQFMAQMAQFSTVEGINNLESTLSSLQGEGLIGKEVTYTTPDGTTVTGTATSIALQDGSYTVHVGADDVDPGKILSVSSAVPAAPPTTGGTAGA
jgi:flagellar basal-body rod modification protein FlgD